MGIFCRSRSARVRSIVLSGRKCKPFQYVGRRADGLSELNQLYCQYAIIELLSYNTIILYNSCRKFATVHAPMFSYYRFRNRRYSRIEIANGGIEIDTYK